jgi:hypothetical protein
MREFFEGWKRRVGVVTLVLACVLMAPVVSPTKSRWFQRYGDNFSDVVEITEGSLMKVRLSLGDNGIASRHVLWKVPFWLCALPLSLLSAYLLLSKPKPTVKPAAAERQTNA